MFGCKGAWGVPYLGIYLRGHCGLASLESSRLGEQKKSGSDFG